MHDRRTFLRIAGAAAGVAALPQSLVAASQSPAGEMRNRKGKYHLRYAPRLDFLAKELSIPERLDLIAQHGFDAIEFNGLMNRPMPEVETLRKQLDDRGLEHGIFVANPGGWKTAGMVAPDQRDAFLGEIGKAIEFHKIIGNRWCTVISGNELEGPPRARQRRNVVEALKRAGDLLAPTKLTIVLEPLNHRDHPGYFFPESDELAEVLATVNHPNVRMLFDFYHLQIGEGDLISHFREHYDLIGYVQTGDVPGRREPGTGEINWRNVFKAVYDKGYAGILGMEHGLSVPGKEGLLKCFDEYKKADTWS
jgi:hydroxypyruvate isomerase